VDSISFERIKALLQLDQYTSKTISFISKPILLSLKNIKIKPILFISNQFNLTIIFPTLPAKKPKIPPGPDYVIRTRLLVIFEKRNPGTFQM